MTVTLERVVGQSLQRGYSPGVFSTLFREYCHQDIPTDVEILFHFSSYPKAYWPLLRLYIYEVLIVSDFNNTSEDFIHFWDAFPRLKPQDQLECVTYLNQLTSMAKIKWELYLVNVEFVDRVVAAVQFAIGGCGSELHLMLAKMLASMLKSIDSSRKVSDKLVATVTEYHKNLLEGGQKLSFIILDAALNEYQSSSAAILAENSEENIAMVAANASTVAKIDAPQATQKENAKVLRLKKFIWLNQNITVEFNDFDEFKTTEFKALLNLNNVPTTDAINFMTMELITGLFNGLEMALPNRKFIWRKYIVWTLPGVLKSTFKINQTKLEGCLNTIKQSSPQLWHRNQGLLAEFEKSLVGLDLLKPSNSAFETLASTANTQIPIKPDELTVEFNQKLIDANPEFISLEDSDVESMLAKISPHIALRLKFNSLVIRAVQTFIVSNDYMRLRRLIICLCIDQDILLSLLLTTSPYKFLEPLLEFVEKNVMEKGSSGDKLIGNPSDIMGDMGFDLDTSNAQSDVTESSIVSILSIFIKFVIGKFELTLKSNKITKLKVGNTISMLTYSQQPLEIKDKETTINRWIISLFDISSTEGISDSLIKASSPLEYSIIFPEIMNSCIRCYKYGWVDEEMIKNGLEYFKEVFLSGWLPNIVNELCNVSWDFDGDEKVDAMLVKCILKLLNSDEVESKEMKIIIGLVKDITNDRVWRSFGHHPDVKTRFTEPVADSVPQDMFSMFRQVIKWLNEQDNESGSPPVESVFDLLPVWRSLENSTLPVEDLVNELVVLISNPLISPDLSYELIAVLIITYSRWKTGTQLTDWVKELVRIKEFKSNGAGTVNDLIFNRTAKENVWTGVAEVKPKQKSEQPEEDDFFGFIQEPKDEDDPMEIDAPLHANTNNHNYDLYGLTMFQIFLDNTNAVVTEKLVRKMVNHL